MPDIFDLDSLFAQMTLALGLALVVGNGLAIYKNRRGEVPENAQGVFRPGRARFLLAVGVIMTTWGAISL